jgi:hypothetical protein
MLIIVSIFIGYPRDDMTLLEKTAYAQELSEETGFDINVVDIVKNPAIVTLSKLSICAVIGNFLPVLLPSVLPSTLLYCIVYIGKMGQSNDKTSKTVIHSYQELVDLRNRGDIKIKHYRILSEKTVLLTYATDQEKVKPYAHGNLFISMQVTAFGRLMLVKACKKLEKNGWLAAYTDTDSIVAVPIVPDPIPLHQLCDIGLRLGYFKVINLILY